MFILYITTIIYQYCDGQSDKKITIGCPAVKSAGRNQTSGPLYSIFDDKCAKQVGHPGKVHRQTARRSPSPKDGNGSDSHGIGFG